MESDAGCKNSACSTNTVGMEFCSTSASASLGFSHHSPSPTGGRETLRPRRAGLVWRSIRTRTEESCFTAHPGEGRAPSQAQSTEAAHPVGEGGNPEAASPKPDQSLTRPQRLPGSLLSVRVFKEWWWERGREQGMGL